MNQIQSRFAAGRLNKLAPAGLVIVLAWLALAGCTRSGPDPYALMEGEGIYKVECAGCHGAKMEGQANWTTRRADGKLPAPPHDATGHTWHHSTERLVAITKFGMVPPHAPAGYISDMPAFAGKLTDAQIMNVLMYIESRWPKEVLESRAKNSVAK